MIPNNKTNHTDTHSGKRMFIIGGGRKSDRPLDSLDFDISQQHLDNDKWLQDNDWSHKKRLKFSEGTMKKHLKKYMKKSVRRIYRGVDKRFVDDPELFKRYLEDFLG